MSLIKAGAEVKDLKAAGHGWWPAALKSNAPRYNIGRNLGDDERRMRETQNSSENYDNIPRGWLTIHCETIVPPARRRPDKLKDILPYTRQLSNLADLATLRHSMSLQSIFTQFQRELDDQNDRRERLIKASRDVTNLSKKVIFLLHRIMNEDVQDARAHSERACERGMEKLREVRDIYAAAKPEIQGDSLWRHHQSISPGLQEYIEALSFAHYLGHGTLISFGQVQTALSDDHGVPYFPLPKDDYLLGLADLTGELMRFAISGFSRKRGRAQAVQVCNFVRDCKSDFDRFTPFVKGLHKKQVVTNQSLEKIENAVYAIVVRTSEYDLPAEILDDVITQSMSDYAHKDRRSYRDVGNDEEREYF